MEYGRAWNIQKGLFNDRVQGKIIDTLIILQHPPTYTFGRRTLYRQPLSDESILSQRDTKNNERTGGLWDETHMNSLNGIPIYKVDRGGGATYHGPGQIVVYPIINLKSYTEDYHIYLRMLEDVILRTLSDFMITGERSKGFTGVWVNGEKIASVGVRIVKGITMHGFSLNVNNDLKPFDYIVPCNIEGVKITSMSKALGRDLNLSDIEDALIEQFVRVFDMVAICDRIVPIQFFYPG